VLPSSLSACPECPENPECRPQSSSPAALSVRFFHQLLRIRYPASPPITHIFRKPDKPTFCKHSTNQRWLTAEILPFPDRRGWLYGWVVGRLAVGPAQRLTTSPPMISATGTDSGISNCSTRARSDSSQSTPVYSGEYPVNMSVESASCVPYHCPADGRDFEEEEVLVQPPAAAETRRADTPLDIPGKLSAFLSPRIACRSFITLYLIRNYARTRGRIRKFMQTYVRLCNKHGSRRGATADGQLLQLKSTIEGTVGDLGF